LPRTAFHDLVIRPKTAPLRLSSDRGARGPAARYSSRATGGGEPSPRRDARRSGMTRLQGKVAIVTGGGGGIGAAVVRRLVAEGARVAVGDVVEASADKVAQPLGDQAIAIRFDAARPESVRELVERTVERFGRLDILHNNAALTDPERQSQDTNAIDIPYDIWNATLSVNVGGYLLGCKYALPHMIAGGGGSIINTASGSGVAGDLARIAYGSSKAAIIALTKYVATQHGHQNIRCNAIAPGVILTEALTRTVPGLAEIIKRHVLTTRFGTPEDVAALVAFLASDESGYITGESIGINGGSLSHQPHYADLAAAMAAAG
jgi:NAD(P)-dependent dehydrogenase (short-subunit alcohol dehydrogenase family)